MVALARQRSWGLRRLDELTELLKDEEPPSQSPERLKLRRTLNELYD